MEYSITLPASQQPMTIRDLLEKEWLVPRKVRHFLRIRKNVLLNNELAMFHQEVYAGDTLTLRLEETDYNYQEIHLGNKKTFILYLKMNILS